MTAAELVRELAQPLSGDANDYDELLRLIGDARGADQRLGRGRTTGDLSVQGLAFLLLLLLLLMIETLRVRVGA